jgi:hypothetical protein
MEGANFVFLVTFEFLGGASNNITLDHAIN